MQVFVRSLLAGLACLVIAGCSGIPPGFTSSTRIHPHVGYRISNETEQGFDLEVAYLEYAFVLVDSTPLIERARGHFFSVLDLLKISPPRAIERPERVELQATLEHNQWDGVVTALIGRRIKYAIPAPIPWSPLQPRIYTAH